MALTTEQHRSLNHLCGMPEHANTAMLYDDLRNILLETGGNVLACGRLWNIKSKAIGAGVYKVTLELANP